MSSVGSRDDSDLEEAFIAFAAFGSARKPRHGRSSGSRISKLARESGMIGGNLTVTDVDIVFGRCKVGRKLDFKAFKKALEMIAERRGCTIEHVKALVIGSEPQLKGTVPDMIPIVEKLTDASLYTGSHRERFDSVTGVGRGAAGRDTVAKTGSLSDIVSRHNPNTTLGSPKVMRVATITPPKSPPTTPRMQSPRTTNGQSVFDRLSSPTTFTGTHKHRFNPDGTGRGLEGRTGEGAGETVNSLSQITRK
ncbi:p25-alpha-domain-containing protein [Chytridium lagenaria]|nr:p25-alpha-domain-containing protein [Chytridium lagenaria]